MRDLLVYVHVPFCTSKCSFCDWVQEIPTSSLRLDSASPPRVAYIEALGRQIATQAPRLLERGYRPRILYWGGGTASILSAGEIARVGESLHRAFPLDGLREATIECSPETVDVEKFRRFGEQGFRRVSLGVQSLDDERLRLIGRAHRAEGAIRSVHAAREAGFDEVNVDIISGFPGETTAEFERSMRRVLELLPFTHVSLYPYRPSAGTSLLRQLRRGVAGSTQLEQQLEAYRVGAEMLEAAGFPEYAMSHFGRVPCWSDLAYFRLDMDWVGFGSGATSLLDGTYSATTRGALERYTADPLRVDEEAPAASAQIADRLFYQALTTREGAIAAQWEEHTREPLARIAELPGIAALLAFFDRAVGVIRDEAGIRLPPRRTAAAYIHLLHLNVPQRAQTRAAAGALFGGY